MRYLANLRSQLASYVQERKGKQLETLKCLPHTICVFESVPIQCISDARHLPVCELLTSIFRHYV